MYISDEYNLEVRQRFFNSLLVTLVWLPASAFTIFNYHQFAQKNILLPYARSLGRAHSSELNFWEFIRVFSETALFVGAVIPILTILTVYIIGLKSVARVVLVLSVGLVLLNYINLITVANTGTLMTWELFVESALTAYNEPDLAEEYVSLSSMVKALALILAVFLIHFFARYLGNRKIPQIARQLLTFLYVFSICAFSSLFVYANLTAKADLNAGVEFVSKQVSSMINIRSDRSDLYDSLTIEESIELFQKLTHAPESDAKDIYAGTETGSNLIVISLETSPSRVIDYEKDPAFVGLKLFASKAFVTKQHHTTYPYTSDALFSMLTSLYPNELRRHLLTETAEKFENILDEGRVGLFHALSESGYSTKVYLPDESPFTNDKLMFGVLGADEIFIPSEELRAQARWTAAAKEVANRLPGYHLASQNEKASFERKARNDLISLEAMSADIEAKAAGGKPFAMVFLPLLGHGPWPDLRPERTIFQTGRDIFLLHDRWIERIYRKLEDAGAADDTVVVITGDHGLRTAGEYSKLQPGIFNAISFQVPLMIYAPNTLKRKVGIPYLTSHIDIMPSILALLGIEGRKTISIGSPIWDSGLERRRTYLLARDYLGVDGYFEEHKFSMFHEISGTVIHSRHLFSDNAEFEAEYVSADDETTLSAFAEQASFQRRLKEYLLTRNRNNGEP